MRPALRDREADRHLVQKSLPLEVRPYMEHELVGCRPERLALEKRLVRSAILIGHRARHRYEIILLKAVQLDLDPGAGTAVARIQHVRRQPTHQDIIFCRRACAMWPICSSALRNSVGTSLASLRFISLITLCRLSCSLSATIQGK